jgi:hypothetical protein
VADLRRAPPSDIRRRCASPKVLTFDRAPIVIGSMSPRSTAPNQIEASSLEQTRPMRSAAQQCGRLRAGSVKHPRMCRPAEAPVGRFQRLCRTDTPNQARRCRACVQGGQRQPTGHGQGLAIAPSRPHGRTGHDIGPTREAEAGHEATDEPRTREANATGRPVTTEQARVNRRQQSRRRSRRQGRGVPTRRVRSEAAPRRLFELASHMPEQNPSRNGGNLSLSRLSGPGN